jgi:hypothetical protein
MVKSRYMWVKLHSGDQSVGEPRLVKMTRPWWRRAMDRIRRRPGHLSNPKPVTFGPAEGDWTITGVSVDGVLTDLSGTLGDDEPV